MCQWNKSEINSLKTHSIVSTENIIYHSKLRQLNIINIVCCLIWIIVERKARLISGLPEADIIFGLPPPPHHPTRKLLLIPVDSRAYSKTFLLP